MVVTNSPGPALRPVPQESIVDRVTAEIRRCILTGILPPGQPFSITSLADQLEVSHIPIREALRRLESQGLLQLRAGRSAIVAPIDPEELQAVYRLRYLLEPDLAGRSAKVFTDDDRSLLRASLQAYRDDVHSPELALTRHAEFHLALLSPAASEWDLRILHMLWQVSERYVRLVFSNELLDEAQGAQLVRAHEPLLEVAQTGTPDQLRRVVKAHLHGNEHHMLEAISGLVAAAPSASERAQPRSRASR
jgi:DNA-binding GntR family transcriptional regulator